MPSRDLSRSSTSRRGDLDRVPRQGFDLYLNVDDGLRYHLPGELRPSAFWAIDTHLDFDRCREKAPGFDVVFAAQRDGVDLLRCIGVCSARGCRWPVTLMFIASTTWPSNTTWRSWEHLSWWRGDLLSLIQRRYRNSFVGQCYFDDMARTYSAARIAFNRSIRNDVNMRVFEAVACGSMLMTNDLGDNGLGELFRDGVQLATYRDHEDLLDKLAFYLEREAVRERIAAAGRAEAIAKHTYAHRMEKVLKEAQDGAVEERRPRGGGERSEPTRIAVTTERVSTKRGRRRRAEAFERRSPALPGGSHPPRENGCPDPFYFGYSRPEVVALVPESARRVLDIGCGAGRLGEAIKQRQQASVCGIEFNARAAEACAAAAGSRLGWRR